MCFSITLLILSRSSWEGFITFVFRTKYLPPWYANGTLSALLEASMASPINVVWSPSGISFDSMHSIFNADSFYHGDLDFLSFVEFKSEFF